MFHVIALRYLYVLALSVWFGGIIVVGVVAAPVSGEVLQRFYLTSYASGGLLLLSLLAMALLGPRPSGFAARLGVAFAMFAMTLYTGLALHNVSTGLMALTAAGGLALLFWEARDGTRAA
jgi:hypothetical protein